jgi:hypothetical protein
MKCPGSRTAGIALALATFSGRVATAQVSPSVDLLSPGDVGFDGIPDIVRCVDVFVEVSTHDVWSAAGIRAVTENGATLQYTDGDANIPGDQPGLINPGFANRFTTSLSRPRNRNGFARFENAGAVPVGAYDPAAIDPVVTPVELNVAYNTNPPATPGSPSVDGYIARISVDVQATGLPLAYEGWDAGLLNAVPPGATVVLRSQAPNFPWGTAVVGFDSDIRGITWALWWIPEPSGGAAALILATCWSANRRR